jgi:ribonucleoside-diphosphate reductase beta chain
MPEQLELDLNQPYKTKDIFANRASFKPFEYDIEIYKHAIQHAFWLVSEWNFQADVQDFHTKLTSVQRSALKNALLAISQIEISVKKFWSRLGDRFPKAEFDQVGMCFAESEVRHSDAYSHLLEVLGLNDEFTMLLQNPVIQGRVDYLTKYLRGAANSSNENYTLTLTLFSLFIENVSLFSQFAIIKSFNKYLNVLKDVDNVVQATQQEEQLHGLFGARVVAIIKEENPEWFNEEFYEKVHRAAKKAFTAESEILDWIFEAGELEFLPKDTLKEFIKQRFNESIEMIGGEKPFEIDQEKLASLEWFRVELLANVNTDFFHKRPTAYSKNVRSITAEDLF